MNLDDVIPEPQYRMCHSRNVAAPPIVVWDQLLPVTMSALPLRGRSRACGSCPHGSPAGTVNPWPDAPFWT
jgi:hypothetical protein